MHFALELTCYGPHLKIKEGKPKPVKTQELDINTSQAKVRKNVYSNHELNIFVFFFLTKIFHRFLNVNLLYCLKSLK